MQREDDFNVRRKHLETLSEAELEKRFWDLAYKIIDPMVELAEKNTSPSIERAVLLQMGFDSITAKIVVDGCIDSGLLSKGAGNVVYQLSQILGKTIEETGLLLSKGVGWDKATQVFKGVTS
jgi:D-ornithine 4,5-aminomutase subunit alpha